MKKLFIIAGHQAAGKTTAKIILEEALRDNFKKYPSTKIQSWDEAGAMIIKKHQGGGGQFISTQQEKEIIEFDLARLKKLIINTQENLIIIDETNIFSLAHANARGLNWEKKYLENYLKYLQSLETTIIFLESLPETSWQRRQRKYQERCLGMDEEQATEAMQSYRTYLNNLYPSLLALYEKMPFPKIKINTDQPENLTIQLISDFVKKHL